MHDAVAVGMRSRNMHNVDSFVVEVKADVSGERDNW